MIIRLTLGFFAFYLTISFSFGAAANVCRTLHAANVEKRFPAAMKSMIGVEDLGPDDIFGTSSLLRDAKHWVTITTGTALWIDCQKNETTEAVYFPIGLLLRPVRDIRFANRSHTIFQTEYGLYVIIDLGAVAPVTAEAGYVFAEENVVYQICKPGERACDPFREPPPREAGAPEWPYISGNKGYLFSPDTEMLLQAATDLESLRDTQLDLVARKVPRSEWPDFAEHPACQPRKAFLFHPFARFDTERINNGAEYPRPNTFSLCTRDPEADVLRFRKIKVISSALASARFEGLWAVSSAEQLDTVVLDAIKSSFGYQDPLLTRVRCGEPLVGSRKSLSELVNSPLNRGQSADLSLVVLADDPQKASKRDIHIRPYETHAGLSNKSAIFSAPLFQDLELSVRCNNDFRVTAAEMLRIFATPIFGPDPVEISLAELNEAYDTHYDGFGRPPDRVALERLENGRLFRICEFIEYINWRTLLRRKFYGHPDIARNAGTLGIAKHTLADHMAHLVMVSFFITEARTIRSREDKEGCEN